MSNRKRKHQDRLSIHANVFAALGDETRLSILARLSTGEAQSIASLTGKTHLTRQAVTKHLRVLEDAGVVHSIREGRESKFTYEPATVENARSYLDQVSRSWDDALARLKTFVED